MKWNMRNIDNVYTFLRLINAQDSRIVDLWVYQQLEHKNDFNP